MKIFFIAPHLSTGGMPQYLYKQIEALYKEHTVYCLEWDDVTGGNLVVQRNRIKNLLGSRLITLDQDKHHLFKLIEEYNPDVIHLQEIPEMFMPFDVADKFYSTNRKYKIVETSHDSSFDINRKLYFPDKFMMVSQYQVETYKPLNIPIQLVEYPIEYKTRTHTREELMNKLGLDPNKKHVINVGLFTPRKNQVEVIEYARMLKHYPIQFHFIGNQADNFQYYWEPLMKDFPSNCKWWGERDDVDTFFEMADLFLFTSRGHATDKETMPLVIREAISWKTPSLIFNLDVYLDYFNKFSNINYLDFNSKENNIQKIIKKLNIKPMINYNIWSRWDAFEQKVYYGTSEDINSPITVALKEYQSDGVLWSGDYDALHKNIEYWMVPINKNMWDYEKDPKFGGIKICIYKKENDELIYEHPYFQKFVNIPRVSLSNSIPYHLNYKEFFIEGKYKKYFNKKFDNIVDAGANVGVFTEYLIQNELSEKIIAIECDSKALKDLKNNFKREYRVEIIPKALNSTNDKITFYQSEENPVISSVIPPDKLKNHMAGVKGNNEVIVDTVTIKDLVDKLGIIDLLKIDIEGAEYEIIKNVNPSLFKNINNLLIECHFFEEDYLEKYSSLIKKLSDNGYKVEEFIKDQAITHKGASEVIFATKNK
jgi:FkbM family methyltransferase